VNPVEYLRGWSITWKCDTTWCTVSLERAATCEGFLSGGETFMEALERARMVIRKRNKCRANR